MHLAELGTGGQPVARPLLPTQDTKQQNGDITFTFRPRFEPATSINERSETWGSKCNHIYLLYCNFNKEEFWIQSCTNEKKGSKYTQAVDF